MKLSNVFRYQLHSTRKFKIMAKSDISSTPLEFEYGLAENSHKSG